MRMMTINVKLIGYYNIYSIFWFAKNISQLLIVLESRHSPAVCKKAHKSYRQDLTFEF